MVTALVAPTATRSVVPAAGLGRRFLARRSLEKGLVLSALVHLSLVGAYRAVVDRAAPPPADQEYGRPIEVRDITVAVIIASKLPFLARSDRKVASPPENGQFMPVPGDEPPSLFPQDVSGPISADPIKGPGGPEHPDFRNDVPPGDAPARFAPVEVQPVPVETPRPTYPDWAREAGIQGTVVLHALVGADGGVKRVVVVRGVRGLDEEASRAVRRWLFRPAMSNGVPLAVWVEIPVAFRL